MESGTPQRFICTERDLEFYLPSAVLKKLKEDENFQREALEDRFGMSIQDHPYFQPEEIEQFPFTDEERNYLVGECGGYLPKTVADLNRMRAILNERKGDNSKRRRGDGEECKG